MTELPPGVIIRKARPNDCAGIIALVQELADFENLSDQVKLTPDELREDGFGEESFYKCLVAESTPTEGTGEPRLIGYGMYFYIYSTFEGRSIHIEDLYITPSYRGQGIGTEIWRQVAQIAMEKRCRRIQFVVLNWNQRAIEFYKNLGCLDLTTTEKWHLFRMCEPDIHQMALKSS